MFTKTITALKCLVGKQRTINVSEVDPHLKVLVVGSPASGKSRGTRTLIKGLVFKDMVCWKIANDLPETIEKEWWN